MFAFSNTAIDASGALAVSAGASSATGGGGDVAMREAGAEKGGAVKAEGVAQEGAAGPYGDGAGGDISSNSSSGVGRKKRARPDKGGGVAKGRLGLSVRSTENGAASAGADEASLWASELSEASEGMEGAEGADAGATQAFALSADASTNGANGANDRPYSASNGRAGRGSSRMGYGTQASEGDTGDSQHATQVFDSLQAAPPSPHLVRPPPSSSSSDRGADMHQVRVLLFP